MTSGIPPSEALTWAGSIAVGAITFALAIQKLLRIWAQGTTDLNSHQGENQVVTLLRTELARVSEHNSTLDTKVGGLTHIIETQRNEILNLQNTLGHVTRELSLLKDHSTYPPDRRQ